MRKADAQLQGRWELDRDHGKCEITFSFAPPHENYAGRVQAATAWLEARGDDGLRGQFVVRVGDVDMGEADLTQNVRYAAEMLRGQDFPDSSFAFEAAEVSRRPGAEAWSVTLEGTFKLKGANVRLTVPAQLQMLSRSGEESELELRGAFELTDLRGRFGICGPGAEDDPAGNRLRFTVHFVLVAAPDAHVP